jgi:hypothetical protein
MVPTLSKEILIVSNDHEVSINADREQEPPVNQSGAILGSEKGTSSLINAKYGTPRNTQDAIWHFGNAFATIGDELKTQHCGKRPRPLPAS